MYGELQRENEGEERQKVNEQCELVLRNLNLAVRLCEIGLWDMWVREQMLVCWVRALCL